MDFVFHYPLNDNGDEVKNLEEYYCKLMKSILEVVEFTANNEIVEVDGFKFINGKECFKLY